MATQDPGYRPTDDSRAKLVVMRAKLADFSLLLNRLLKEYSKNSQTRRDLEAIYLKIKQGYAITDTLLGQGGRPATEKDLKDFQSKWADIATSMEEIAVMAVKSSRFSDVLQRVAAETNITFANLQQAAKGISSEAGDIGMEREGLSEYMKRAHPSVYGYGQAAKSEFLSQAFGPFYPIGKIALGTISGVRGYFREKRSRASMKSYWQKFGPAGYSFKPEDVEGYAGPKGRAGGGLPIGDVFQNPTQAHVNAFTQFFSTGAYGAKYTKELLESIKEISGKKGDGKGLGFMEGLASGGLLKGVLKWGGRALAGIGAAMMTPEFLTVAGIIAGSVALFLAGKWGLDKLKGFDKSHPEGSKLTAGQMAQRTSLQTLSTASRVMPSPFGIGGMLGAGTMISPHVKEPVKTAEEIGLGGAVGFGLRAMDIVSAIKDAFSDVAKTIVTSNAQATVVTPRPQTISPYRAADPLIDYLNKNSE